MMKIRDAIKHLWTKTKKNLDFGGSRGRLDADLFRKGDAGGEKGGGGVDDRLSVNNNSNKNNLDAVEVEVVRTPISSEKATMVVKEAAEASTIVSPSTTTVTTISTSVKVEVDRPPRRSLQPRRRWR